MSSTWFALCTALVLCQLNGGYASTWQHNLGDEVTALLPGGEPMQFVWIPPGSFIMGTSPEEERTLRAAGLWQARFTNEQPTRERFVHEGFYLGKYEITQRQWTAAMGTRPWGRYIAEQEHAAAVCLSWDAVQAFVGRLNEALGDSVYRLPSEVEWEYAARAGSSTPWFFGAEQAALDDYAWFEDNSWAKGARSPLPVGLKRPNPWGLHDIYGNAWEWCQEELLPYGAEDFVGPVQPLHGDVRVMRGGCFNSNRYIRSAVRGTGVPSVRYNIFTGARIVRMQRPAD